MSQSSHGDERTVSGPLEVCHVEPVESWPEDPDFAIAKRPAVQFTEHDARAVSQASAAKDFPLSALDVQLQDIGSAVCNLADEPGEVPDWNDAPFTVVTE